MRSHKLSYIIFIICCLLSHSVAAQEQGVLLSGGMCMPNSSEFSYIQQPILGVGYTCDWTQRDAWRLGLRADAMVMRHSIAGPRLTGAFTIEERLFGPVSDVLEVGLSAYGNPYWISMDSANVFIGSVLNCHIGMGLRYRFPLDEQHSMSASVRIIHSSNGYLLKPNKGLNYLVAEMGLHFAPYHPLVAPVYTEEQPLRPLTFFCSYAPSIVQQRAKEIVTDYAYAYSFLLGALHPLSSLRSVGAEVDLMYNYTHRIDARQSGEDIPKPYYWALCGTYQRNWDRLFLRLSFGAYLMHSRYLMGQVYERISFNYRMVDHWRLTPYVGVGCKAYFGHIDYVEWTLGFEF